MAIASVGTLGTGVSSTSSSSFTLATATNSLASGDFGLLTVVADNRTGSDGLNNEHTGVSGGTGKWRKIGEWTNSVGGAAADGVTTSLWLFEATGTVNTGTTITITLSGTATDKVASFWKFTKGAGTKIVLDLEATINGINNNTDASNGFGSAAFSGLSSASRLYFRALGKEANSTTALTVSTNFTQITNTRSRNNASAVGVWGEFRVNTSTGETSNPTLAVSGDTAGIFVALKEVTALTTAPAADNFDDNSVDTTFWNSGQPFVGAYNSSATMAEQNARTEITPATSATGFKGRSTVSTYDFTQGLRAYIKITPSATLKQGQQIQLVVGSDPLNCYAIQVSNDAGSITISGLRVNNGSTGGWGGFGTAYLPSSTHGWIALSYNTGDSKIHAECASATGADPPASWTDLGSETSQIELSAVRVGFQCGAYSGDASPVRVDFDGFNGSTSAALVLTPGLFTNTSDFPAATVLAGPVALTPSLFTNTSSFPAATVANLQSLTPSLFTNDQAFFAHSVAAGAVTLTPSLFTNAQSFFAPTITTGATTLAPSLFTNSQTFNVSTVSAGAVALTPSLFSNAQTFYGPSITVGATTLAPSLFTNLQIFFSPSLAEGNVDLVPALFSNSQTFFSPTIATGGVALTASLFANVQEFHNPSIAVGDVILAPALFTNAQTFFTHSIVGGQVGLLPDLFANSSEFFDTAVQVGPVNLQPDLLANAQTFFDAVVGTAEQENIFPPLVENDNEFFQASVSFGTQANRGFGHPEKPRRVINYSQFYASESSDSASFVGTVKAIGVLAISEAQDRAHFEIGVRTIASIRTIETADARSNMDWIEHDNDFLLAA